MRYIGHRSGTMQEAVRKKFKKKNIRKIGKIGMKENRRKKGIKEH